jgi:hypothetical protein
MVLPDCILRAQQVLLFEVHYDEHDADASHQDASRQDKPDTPSTQVTSVGVCAFACMFNLFFSIHCPFGISLSQFFFGTKFAVFKTLSLSMSR